MLYYITLYPFDLTDRLLTGGWLKLVLVYPTGPLVIFHNKKM